MSTTALAPQVFPNCPTTLTPEQVDQYWRTGWLAFENALSPDEVEVARQGIADMVRRYAFNDELATYRAPSGNVGNQSGAAFNGRHNRFHMQLEAGFTPDPAKMDDLEHAVRKFMNFEDECPLYRSICTDHPRIQGILRDVMGEELALYQSMALIKPARIGSEKPWHQDNAYFSVADMDGVIGTWIALDDALIENGCMHMLSGGHRLGPLRHHHTFDCEILPGRIQPELAEPVELHAGGMVIFHANLPHQTPPNTSASRRRALQFHYRRLSNEIIPTAEYDAIYKEADGTPASCAYARKNGF